MKANETMPTCPCQWCGKQTPMLGTKECDNCHELATRIQRNPEIAFRMLAAHPTFSPTGRIKTGSLVGELTQRLRARV